MPSLYLLDTNAVSAVMADHPKIKAKLSLQPGRIATSAIVRGEIRYGLERLPPGKRRTNLEAKAGVVFAAMAIEPVTQAAADVYGTIRRALEIQGLSIDDNDLWIAAATLSLSATLVTSDQQFSRVPGLVVEDWTK
jgi:predicted nucleic acid-binding protein